MVVMVMVEIFWIPPELLGPCRWSEFSDTYCYINVNTSVYERLPLGEYGHVWIY